jgi:predicted PurR-regulated permease PerM
VKTQAEWPTIYAVVVLLTAAAFLVSVRVVLSPVIMYMVLLLLISPWAGNRYHVLTVTAATFLIGVWLLKTLGGLLAPFILAFVLAYILDPIVDRLERRGMRRAWAVAALAVPALVLIAVGLIFGVPAVIEQVNTLIEQLPAALQRGVTWLQNLRTRWRRGRGAPSWVSGAASRSSSASLATWCSRRYSRYTSCSISTG